VGYRFVVALGEGEMKMRFAKAKLVLMLVFALLLLSACSDSTAPSSNETAPQAEVQVPSQQRPVESSESTEPSSQETNPPNITESSGSDVEPVRPISDGDRFLFIYRPQSKNYLAVEPLPREIDHFAIYTKIADYFGFPIELNGILYNEVSHSDGSVHVDESWPIVDFKGSFTDQYLAVEETRETFLHSVSASIKNQVLISAQITFLRDGEPYYSTIAPYEGAPLSIKVPGGYSFAQHSISIGTLPPEEYTQLRQTVPYPGLPDNSKWSRDEPYIIEPPGERGREFVALLNRMTFHKRIQFISPDEIDTDSLISIGIWESELLSVEDYPQLKPIADSVLDIQFRLKEHIEATIQDIFGEVAEIPHHSVNLYDWYENEGVYTPPHIGMSHAPMPVILNCEENETSYILTVVYLDGAYLWDYPYDDAEAAEPIVVQLQEQALHTETRYETVLRKQPDGTVTIYSQREM
jgi:hypothetical protein